MEKKKPLTRNLTPAPLEKLQFDVLMNEHFHATQQCLCDMAIAMSDVTATYPLEQSLNARINDATTERTERGAALLYAVHAAVQLHAARKRGYRT